MNSAPGDRPLTGVIDIHCHTGPDSYTRILDSIDLARLAKQRGMRGIVLKNHHESTASLACLTSKVVPGIEVFGGVTLNLAVGGMNPHAVDHMARVAGKRGRFVWMGSLDTEAQVRHEQRSRPFVSISRNGELLPETIEVLKVVASHKLVLETGHWSAGEALMLINEAHKQGVTKIVVTHAMIAPIHMQITHMKQAAESGAWIEFVYNGLTGPHKEFDFSDYACAIRAVGIDRCVLSSDMGQPINVSHPEGLANLFGGLEAEGFAAAEIDVMSRRNPALILDLD